MAYSTSNPPQVVAQGIGNEKNALWVYGSADNQATVAAGGYVSNAKSLGLKVGDLVIVFVSGGPTNVLFTVAAINTNGSANLSSGTAIS